MSFLWFVFRFKERKVVYSSCSPEYKDESAIIDVFTINHIFYPKWIDWHLEHRGIRNNCLFYALMFNTVEHGCGKYGDLNNY